MPTTSPPINLGQTGLVLDLRVYFQALGLAPVLQAVGAEAVVELTLGDYYLASLPDPPGVDVGLAVVFDPAGDTALALSTYEYRSAATPAIASPVINFGEAGLTLGVRVYFRAPGEAPDLQAAGAESVVDLGSGDYYLASLPNPGVDSRGIAVVFSPAAPTSALATYEYGSATAVAPADPPAVVWRNEIELPSNPQPIKVDDTLGSIVLTVLSGLPEEISAVGTSATFTLWDREASAALAADSPAAISGVLFDAATESYGCILSAPLATLSDPLVAGELLGEFQIDFASGLRTTIPKDNSMRVLVVADFNG